MLHVNDGRAGRFMPPAPLLLVLAALAAAAESPCSVKTQLVMASCRGRLFQQPNATALAAGSLHDPLRNFSYMSNELAAAFNISFDFVDDFANCSSDTRLQQCLWPHLLQPFARASLSLQTFASCHHIPLVAGTTMPLPLNAGIIAGIDVNGKLAASAAVYEPQRPDAADIVIAAFAATTRRLQLVQVSMAALALEAHDFVLSITNVEVVTMLVAGPMWTLVYVLAALPFFTRIGRKGRRIAWLKHRRRTRMPKVMMRLRRRRPLTSSAARYRRRVGRLLEIITSTRSTSGKHTSSLN